MSKGKKVGNGSTILFNRNCSTGNCSFKEVDRNWSTETGRQKLVDIKLLREIVDRNWSTEKAGQVNIDWKICLTKANMQCLKEKARQKDRNQLIDKKSLQMKTDR